MSFLHVRSLKRNRLLRRLAIFSLLTAFTFLFVSWLTETPFIKEQQQRRTSPIISKQQPPRYGHVKEHHHTAAAGGDVDVTVPRDFVLDSIRRIRNNRKRPTQRVPEYLKNNNDNPDTIQQQQQQQKDSETDRSNIVVTPSNNDTPTNNNQGNKEEKPMYPEDKVYKQDRDQEFLPPGDGTDPNEKYLGFYPHSGFHNQRIALVNALLLAERLNRTLLLPPVVLGEPIHWRKYDSLESFHRRMTKAHLDHCQASLETPENASETCLASYRYTSLRWDRLFDMSTLKQRVRIRYRDDYDRSYLQRQYNISAHDTYHVKDSILYDYRIADVKDHGKPLAKYQRELYMEDLEAIPQRLLSFGSLFGTGRVMASTSEAQELRDFLFRQFVFSRKALPDLFEEAEAIIRRLGGTGTYVAIHARVGDSIFERFSGDVMGKLWRDLQKYAPLVQQPRTEGCLAPPSLSDVSFSSRAIDWQSKTTSRPLVVFMATDSLDPHNDPLFEQIFQLFPCIVTLNDMFDFKQSKLFDMVNPEDGIKYGKFLVPFLDGLIASHAQEFTGSMWSTFSSYIKFLHQQYIPN
ncbi:hypothetical protein BDA99DRAFT_504602 [Phascolomyces articulosus]|uniref:Uncharacterized protein n=1 Tax=Phascolomyces articulosus TaxID=60185 RepID=A0AAD5K3K2_9FUNG|nr:hypothetical protein BDA99DRAFT_504602 [Phascolomyces articulosus]